MKTTIDFSQINIHPYLEFTWNIENRILIVNICIKIPLLQKKIYKYKKKKEQKEKIFPYRISYKISEKEPRTLARFSIKKKKKLTYFSHEFSPNLRLQFIHTHAQSSVFKARLNRFQRSKFKDCLTSYITDC